MRFYRRAIVLLIVMCLLVTICIIYKSKNSSDVKTDSITTNILDVRQDDIVEIIMNIQMGKFAFERVGDKWNAVYPLNLKFDNMRIDGIAYTMANLNIKAIIEKEAANLDQYGLDKPSTVTIKLKDGNSHTLEIGNVTPLSNGYYVKMENDYIIYKVNQGVGQELLQTEKEFRDRRLFDLIKEDFTCFHMEKAGEFMFDAQKKDEFWDVTFPVDGNTDLKGLAPIFDNLSLLCVNNYIEDNAEELDKYGLNNPEYTVVVKSTKFNKTLFLGNETQQDESIYARLDGSNEVFTVLLQDIGFVNSLKEVPIFAYTPQIEDVSSVKIEMDGDIIEAGIQAYENDKDKNKYFIDGKDASVSDKEGDSLFEKFYKLFAYITMADAEPDVKVSGQSEITFTYTLRREPQIVKLEFIPKNDTYYYVVKNQRYSGMLVNRSKFDEPEGLRDSYCKLINSMNQ